MKNSYYVSAQFEPNLSSHKKESKSMIKSTLGRVLCAVALMAASVGPALACDYENKQVGWVLKAPIRLTGALTGAVVSGGVCGPIDRSFHWMVKGTKHVAGKLGNEKGTAQIACAAPIGGTTGSVLGAAYGVPYGGMHGFKDGWNHPFSRWSYTTLPEEK